MYERRLPYWLDRALPEGNADQADQGDHAGQEQPAHRDAHASRGTDTGVREGRDARGSASAPRGFALGYRGFAGEGLGLADGLGALGERRDADGLGHGLAGGGPCSRSVAAADLALVVAAGALVADVGADLAIGGVSEDRAADYAAGAVAYTSPVTVQPVALPGTSPST